MTSAADKFTRNVRKYVAVAVIAESAAASLRLIGFARSNGFMFHFKRFT